MIDELTEEQLFSADSSGNDYSESRPVVVCIYGRLRSAFIAAAFTEHRVAWADDAALDLLAPHPADHFAPHPASGDRHGPSVYRDGTVGIRKVTPDDDDYRA